MPSLLRQDRHFGEFGTLDTGTPPPNLRDDASPRKENITHVRRGGIQPRRGRRVLHRLEPYWRNPYVRLAGPNIFGYAATPGIAVGRTIHVRQTFHTATGETDDHNTRVVAHTVAGFARELRVHALFHVRRVTVDEYSVVGGVGTFHIAETGSVLGFDNDTFNGFLIFARDPIIQDEAHKGVNVGAAEPLWNRLHPLAVVADYVRERPDLVPAGTHLFTLDRDPGDLTGVVIDIMMPDRDGLPLDSTSIYCRDTTPGFETFTDSCVTPFYHVATLQEAGVAIIKALPTKTETQAPSTRITRAKPVLSEIVVRDSTLEDPRSVVADTRIIGGEYRLRYCWESADARYDSPHWPTSGRHLPAQLWPSLSETVQVRDGHGIRAVLPTRPDGVRTAHLYATKVLPYDTRTFAGVINPAPNTTQRAYRNTSLAGGLDPRTASPAAFRASGAVTEFSTAEYATIVDPDATFAPAVAPTPTLAQWKHQFEFWLDVGSDLRSTCLDLMFRGVKPSGYSPASAATITVRYWRQDTATWVVAAGPYSPSALPRRVRLCVPMTSAYLEPAGGGGAMAIWDVLVDDGAAVAVADKPYSLTYSARCEVYLRDPSQGLTLSRDPIYYTRSTYVGGPIGPWIDDDDSKETWQERGLGTLDLRHPLVLHWRQGRIMPLGPDHQAPPSMHDWKVIGTDGKSVQETRLVVGFANSLFLKTQEGLRRFYQEPLDPGADGLPQYRTCLRDWLFTHYRDRLWAWNAEKGDHAVRFDTIAAYPWGLADPPSPPGSLRIVETAGEVTGNYRWHVKYVRRVDPASRFGYVIRSKPVLVGEVRSAVQATVELALQPPTDPQATHFAVYRNITGTNRYFLVDEVPIGEVPPDGVYRFLDDQPDSGLRVFMEFETGRPPAPYVCEHHEGRNWLVPQDAREQVHFTNIVDEDGYSDPEGYFSTHFVTPKQPLSAPVTALAPYHSALIAYNLHGGLLLTGNGTGSNTAEDVSAREIVGSGGAVGSRAWARWEDKQAVLTPKGPAVCNGQQIIGMEKRITGTWALTNKDLSILESCRVLHYRTSGDEALWFGVTQSGDGVLDRALVMEADEDDLGKWSEFLNFPMYGAVTHLDEFGNEMPLIGDPFGYIYQADLGHTDAGEFVEARYDTKPFDSNEIARSHQVRFIYVAVRPVGAHHFMLFRWYPDYSPTAREPRPVRLDLIPEFTKTWGVSGVATDFAWGDGTLYGGLSPQEYKEHRVGVGGVYRRIQLSFHSTWADLPPGCHRETTWECAGFDEFSRLKGPRPSGARAAVLAR